MRPIVAAVFFTLLLSAPLLGVGYILGQRDCQRAEPQQVVGPRGERGLPGVNGTDGKPGQDCDCAGLKAEAIEYVTAAEQRQAATEGRLAALESRFIEINCEGKERLWVCEGNLKLESRDQQDLIKRIEREIFNDRKKMELLRKAALELDASVKKLEASQCKCKCR